MLDHWWLDSVVYQVYMRSFADSDGDGIGDLNGLRGRLDHLRDLGVDALWLNPCYPSPGRDHGYDIADYTDIDRAYGTLADFDEMLAAAHDRGIAVVMDMVANHCSIDHPWFREALRSAPGTAQRQRFLFRDGRGPDGAAPPNDWTSVFGGPAWTRIREADGRPGQWYLHLFDPGQPDFDWRHPEVRAMFRDVLRFWFDRGVDGFRLDVAHGLVKHPDLADWPRPDDGRPSYNRHMWNQPEVHQIYRTWRALAESYAPPRLLIGEIFVPEPADLRRYLRADELHQAFYFELLGQAWDAAAYARTVARGLAACGPHPTWTLANHDVPRAVTRLGTTTPAGFDAGDDLLAAARVRGELDLAVGSRRARAALMLVLALPGSVYLYQGEELGLPEVLDLPDDARQDPIWHRSGGAEPGRDGCRVPLPWQASGASHGFSPDDAVLPPWLPQPEWFSRYAVAAQRSDPGSMLQLCRLALVLRREQWGSAAGPVTWLDAGAPTVLAFARGASCCVVNFGSTDYPLPTRWGTPSLASSTGDPGVLPADSACWLR